MHNNLKLKMFPSLSDSNRLDSAWKQLVFGINRYDHKSYREIVEYAWSKLYQINNQVQNVDIKNSEDEAWFHLRRTVRENKIATEKQYAFGRIEVLRLKNEFIPQESYEVMRLVATEFDDVVCAGWLPLNFTRIQHDNVFLSFLQKLSVLRIENGIVYEKYLGNISSVKDYDKCPYCQEAYNVMMTPSSPWSEALEPWFDHFNKSKVGANITHEYAHWFGHILSGWSV